MIYFGALMRGASMAEFALALIPLVAALAILAGVVERAVNRITDRMLARSERLAAQAA
jgi:hypothetical protein